ncbi:MAG: hypothetical protein ACTS3F_04405, partial [Phycisphaerales bacterium]
MMHGRAAGWILRGRMGLGRGGRLSTASGIGVLGLGLGLGLGGVLGCSAGGEPRSDAAGGARHAPVLLRDDVGVADGGLGSRDVFEGDDGEMAAVTDAYAALGDGALRAGHGG